VRQQIKQRHPACQVIDPPQLPVMIRELRPAGLAKHEAAQIIAEFDRCSI
jgi:hypothetical protein